MKPKSKPKTLTEVYQRQIRMERFLWRLSIKMTNIGNGWNDPVWTNKWLVDCAKFIQCSVETNNYKGAFAEPAKGIDNET